MQYESHIKCGNNQLSSACNMHIYAMRITYKM